MGKRGPAPIPTQILALRGSRLVKNREGEPQPEAGAPPAPEWLGGEAKAEWERVVDVSPPGLLTLADRPSLTAYCIAWAEFVDATQALAKEGRVYETPGGQRKPHPAVAMQRSAWDAVVKFGALLGLDPANRSRLSVPRAEKAKKGVMARERA